MAVTFPSQLAAGLSYSQLQLSLLDRLLVEAWIFVVATVALTLLGWVMSILQIELDSVPQDPNQTENERSAGGGDESRGI